jgi:hypothetical protein
MAADGCANNASQNATNPASRAGDDSARSQEVGRLRPDQTLPTAAVIAEPATHCLRGPANVGEGRLQGGKP